LIIGIASILLSIIEVYYLYIISFKLFVNIYKEHNINEDVEFRDDLIYSFYAIMARIALESSEEPIEELKVDLFKKKSKYSYYVIKSLYKLKIILSNAVAKAIMRKILMNTGFRSLADYIAAPITGLWDALIIYFITKKMEYIFVCTKKIDQFFIESNFFEKSYSDKLKEIMLRIIVNAISYDMEYHPNYKHIIKLFKKYNFITVDYNSIEDIYNIELLKKRVMELNSREKEVIYKFYELVVSVSKSGRLDFKL
jgi:hypothetical protein